MTALTLHAPAKLNLTLHLTGKRSDGYHLIESLVAFTAFGDTLTITPAKTLNLSVTGPFAGMLRDSADHNLVMKAASMLRLHTGCSEGAHIVLDKHIPVGAGLGGGSSDAAAALNGLRAFWKLDNDDHLLMDIALKLGSDVPVCLAAQPALVSGIGEVIKPVTLSARATAILVNPGTPLLTADVYRRFSGSFTPSGMKTGGFNSFESMVKCLQEGHNDLERPAISMLPAIDELLMILRSTPGCQFAGMSGSGATCFALYDNEQVAERALALLTRPEWWCVLTTLQDSQGPDGKTQ